MKSNLPEGWRRKKIKEIARVTSGKRPPTVSSQKSPNNTIPIYGGAGIMGYTNEALFRVPILITGRVGTLGLLHKSTSSCWPSDNTLVVIPHKREDLEFIYYALKMKMSNILMLNRGTSNPLVTQKDIEELEISEPEFQQEKAKVSEILGSLDDKIELNYEMNKTLEAIAQAIFKNWFVDFGPFKNELVYNKELDREIPEGWKITTIGDVVDSKKGLSYSSEELTNESDVGLVNLKCIARGGGYRDEVKPYSGEYKQELTLQTGDIVVAITDLTRNKEVIGMPARICPSQNFEILIPSLDLVVLSPKNKTGLKQSFLYHLLLTRDYWGYVNGCADGTTVLHLNPDDILNYRFVLPPEEWQVKFSNIADLFFELEILNFKEAKILEKIRDSLLPKLLSGEIRVQADVNKEFPEETKRLQEINGEKIKLQGSSEGLL